MKEHIARAILKRRFYDCEPDMYGHDLERFFAELDSEHMHGARDEAEAVLDAMREPTEGLEKKVRELSGGFNDRPMYQAYIDAAKAERPG